MNPPEWPHVLIECKACKPDQERKHIYYHCIHCDRHWIETDSPAGRVVEREHGSAAGESERSQG